MRISDWSSDVCSSDLRAILDGGGSASGAGNDSIDSGAGNDAVAGDAFAKGLSALARAFNKAVASVTGTATAGNDDIDVGTGADTVAGDALARGAESTASVTNDAEATVASGVAEAGNDLIFANADTRGAVIAGADRKSAAEGKSV